LKLCLKFGAELIKILSCVQKKKFLAYKFVEYGFSASFVAEISAALTEREQHCVKFRLCDFFRAYGGYNS